MSTLRGRLIVGLLSGITLFLAVTGVAVDQAFGARLRAEQDSALELLLRSSVREVARAHGPRAARPFGGGPAGERRSARPPESLPDRPGDRPGERAGERAADRPGDRSGDRRLEPLPIVLREDVLMQAWTGDGTLLVRSVALGEADLPRLVEGVPALPLSALASVEPLRADVELPGVEHPVRAAGLRFVVGGGPPGPRGRSARDRGPPRSAGGGQVIEVVVAEDSGTQLAALAELRWMLVLGWLVSSLGCAGIVSWIVHRGLSPLDRLRAQMDAGDGDDLLRRFSLPDAPGELAPVVEQLNAFMARIGQAFLREQAFASHAAHELRTPLAGLRSTLEVTLSRERDAAAHRGAAERALAITLEMQALVETLLDLARVETVPRLPPEQPVSLATIVDDCWRPHAELATSRGLSLERQLDGVPAVRVDVPLLSRVLGNLFENAASYADEATVIEVSAAPLGDGLALTVANSIAGQDDELPRHAFEAFWRADSSRSATGRHAGLGLSLCRRIVETLGGTIAASYRGDRFSVTVSLARC